MSADRLHPRAASRDRARAETTASIARAPLIAFVEDDECADPNWATQRLNAQAKFDADVVFGQVLGVLEGDSLVVSIQTSFGTLGPQGFSQYDSDGIPMPPL